MRFPASSRWSESAALSVKLGGSGVVYRGRQPEFGRWVAVKVFAPDEDVRRLERERLAVGRISDHPGIVPVLGGGVTGDGRPYLIMSYMDGGSLADRVAARGALGVPELITFGTAMATALQAAHDNGIWHRDIKPANILYDRYDSPRLADFGIAHVGLDAFRTETGKLSGTAAYLAPELIDGRPFTAASDVFSLGATLYYALAGHHLYRPKPEEPYPAFLIRRITTPHAPSFPPGVPGWLQAVVAAATDPDPARRPQTAAALGASLRQNGRPIATDPEQLAFTAAASAATTITTPAPPPSPPAAPAWGAPAAGGPAPAPGGPAWGSPGPPAPGTRQRAGRAQAVTTGVAIAGIIGAAGVLWATSRHGPGTAAVQSPRTVVSSPRGTGTGPPGSTRTEAAANATDGTDGTQATAGSTGQPDAGSTGRPHAGGMDAPGIGAAAVHRAVAAYRAAAGGGNPQALEMVFYPFPGPGSGAYAVATLPEPGHPALADRFGYRDGTVSAGEPVPDSPDTAAAKRWRFDDVNWPAIGAMLRGADSVCRAAMTRAGLPDQPDAFGRRAGVTHVIVERDTVFSAGKIVVRVYFGGGARWHGGYMMYSATGRVITNRYCTGS